MTIKRYSVQEKIILESFTWFSIFSDPASEHEHQLTGTVVQHEQICESGAGHAWEQWDSQRGSYGLDMCRGGRKGGRRQRRSMDVMKEDAGIGGDVGRWFNEEKYYEWQQRNALHRMTSHKSETINVWSEEVIWGKLQVTEDFLWGVLKTKAKKNPKNTFRFKAQLLWCCRPRWALKANLLIISNTCMRQFVFEQRSRES